MRLSNVLVRQWAPAMLSTSSQTLFYFLIKSIIFCSSFFWRTYCYFSALWSPSSNWRCSISSAFSRRMTWTSCSLKMDICCVYVLRELSIPCCIFSSWDAARATSYSNLCAVGSLSNCRCCSYPRFGDITARVELASCCIRCVSERLMFGEFCIWSGYHNS